MNGGKKRTSIFGASIIVGQITRQERERRPLK
jgi:hypothetical protein